MNDIAGRGRVSRFFVTTCLASTMLTLAARPTSAATISINNWSSSIYTIRDESAGNTVVVTDTNRESVQSYTLTDGHNYRVRVGQEGDQGSHFFKVNASGQIAYDPSPSNQPTNYFYNPTPTSLVIGAIPVYIRQLSGPDSTFFTPGIDMYFPAFISTVGVDHIVNLTPSDGQFVGNWKNIFPYAFVQQTPMQLGPIPGHPDIPGIISMTGDGTNNPGQTTIVSTTQINFTESGRNFRGFQVTVDRSDSNQLGDGAQFLFFTELPEPASAAMLLAIFAPAALRRTRGSFQSVKA